ncbi:MAG: hypothetical protein ACI9XJ_001689 [Marivirga sp.]|jgi:hypothetical protein
MRVIGEIVNPQCKITIFHWNERYLVKFEIGMYEQTYKMDEYEIENEEALKALIDDDFVQKIMNRFDAMHKDWGTLIN